MTTLLWSEQGGAERWGALLAAQARVKRLSLADLLVEVLPKLAGLKRLVGTDWSSEPIAPEAEPAELARRLRSEAPALFARRATHRDAVWVLQGADGLACLMSRTQRGAQMLPCWYERGHAEARIAGPLGDSLAAAIPLPDFRQKTLTWLAETGRLVAPAYCEGDGQIELEASALGILLGGGPSEPPDAGRASHLLHAH
jgi:hypothetical protein